MNHYDLIIIGGGPGAVAAGVYAARKRIRSLLICRDWGGQSNVSPDIQNFIGIKSLSGIELAERLKEHVKAYADEVLDFDEGSLAVRVSQELSTSETGGPIFEAETDRNKRYRTRAIIVASGQKRRKLEVPGAEEFEGRGVVYCASCDAPLFKGKEVAVIGGGNAGLESAQQLLEYATRIYILEYGQEFRGDTITKEKVFSDQRVVPLTSAQTIEIKGDKFVKGLVYLNRQSGEKKEISVQGVFIEIGSVPNSEFIKNLVKTNQGGEIIIDNRTCRTSLEGIWAAGDVTDQPYKQNNISMGDAVKALEDFYLWLQKRKSAR